jgi:hypothetical protein
MRPKETFRSAEARQKAIETVKSYLLSRGATIEKLRNLPNVGFETKKNSGSWIEAAMFLDAKDLNMNEQVRTERTSSVWFDTVDTKGNTRNNYLCVWNNPPEFKLMDKEPDMNLTGQLTHMSKPSANVSMESPVMADIVITDDARPKKGRMEDSYRVSKGLFLDVPVSVQKELGIELKSTTILLVTKMKKIKG